MGPTVLSDDTPCERVKILARLINMGTAARLHSDMSILQQRHEKDHFSWNMDRTVLVRSMCLFYERGPVEKIPEVTVC